MAFNLKNRSFLKEIDFTPQELRYLLRLSEALKLAKWWRFSIPLVLMLGVLIMVVLSITVIIPQ